MPNWCRNTINISGPEEDIQRFHTQARGPTQSYNEFSPHTKEAWPVFEEIRLRSKASTLPEPGRVVDFSFHSLYPVPEEFRCFPYDDQRARELGELVGQERPYGGYQWEGIHWGCKWGACESELVHKEDTFLQYEFDTAWGPPIKFFEQMTEDWPTLFFELKYEEPGMGFKGEVHWSDGSLVHEVEEEYYEEEIDDE